MFTRIFNFIENAGKLCKNNKITECCLLKNVFAILLFQNPNEDTEWNDILRAKGILPPKKEKEITEEDVINIVEQTVREKQNGKMIKVY